MRNEDELDNVREYIAGNPLKWELDRENPEAQITGEDDPWESKDALRE